MIELEDRLTNYVENRAVTQNYLQAQLGRLRPSCLSKFSQLYTIKLVTATTLPILFILIYDFWISPDFKEILAGVAIFVFGIVPLEEGIKAFTGGLLEKLLHISSGTYGGVIK